jgi:hypothetical protein
MMATSKGITQPKADQPRVDTKSLSKGEGGSNLTMRQTGFKTSYGKSQRDSNRQQTRS